MIFIKKITALLLLSIFSLTQLHSILPHLHHDHSSDLVEITEVHHHHDDHSGHNNFPAESNDHDYDLSLLDHLFKNHSHNDSTESPVILINNGLDQLIDNDVFTERLTVNYSQKLLFHNEQGTLNYTYLHERKNNFRFLVFSHRGPPGLV